MPGNIVPGPILNAAVRTNVVAGYEEAQQNAAMLSAVVEEVEKSDKFRETLVYREAFPLPRRKDEGDNVPYGVTKYKSYNIVNRQWSVGVQIHTNHLADDQTGMLKTEPNRAGARMFQLRERVMFQILNASSDNALLPSVPNAPDGVALYSATDGDGADRFGVSGGNILSGQTMNSAATIRAGALGGILRVASFRDTENQPIWTDGEIKDVVMAAPMSVYDLYLEAFRFELAGGRAEPASGVGIPNDALSQYFKENKFKLRIYPSLRITTATDLHIIINAGKYRAIKFQPREPLKLTPHPENAGSSFEDGYLKWKAEERWGMGVGLPINQVIVQA